jgi:large exoprotein involved in heme utilization and adhesion
VQINNFGVDVNAGVVQLPVDFVDPNQQIATGCNAQGSRFVATGRGGLPTNPTEQVENDRPWSDIRNVSTWQQPGQPVAQGPTPKTQRPIIEASTFMRNSNGEVELIAQPTSGNTELGYAPVTCAATKSVSNR